MPEQTTQNGAKPPETPEGITKITVGGYKSIAQEQSIEIRPLTILAGANSSGKSSIMQPLLLLKQTLEAPYDPGALLLNGPDVKITSTNQLFSKPQASSEENVFTVGVLCNAGDDLGYMPGCKIQFIQSSMPSIKIKQIDYSLKNRTISVHQGMSHEEIKDVLPNSYSFLLSGELSITPNRCFLDVESSQELKANEGSEIRSVIKGAIKLTMSSSWLPNDGTRERLQEIIHVPGLRGNPERSYPVTAVSERFPGPFESYVASVIARWQSEEDTTKMAALQQATVQLGLTNLVAAQPINDTQVELRVGRTRSSNSQDTVSIADVGFGVSQTLPVLVALLAAKPGQLVYIEQPEIHLHPRAQTAMAQVLADAAMRGVRVVAETHSSLLLLGIQTLVAEGKLPPDLVKLHSFERGDDGATTIRSADLDETGAFGDWPEDFDDVTLNAQSRYLDAAERRLVGK